MIRRLSLVLIAVAALAAPSSAVAGKTLDVSPQQLEFGEQPFHSFTKQGLHRQEREQEAVAVSVETGFVPDDFSPGQPESTCAPFGSTTLAKDRAAPTWSGTTPTRPPRSSVTAGSTSGSWRGREGEDRRHQDRRGDRHPGGAGGCPRRQPEQRELRRSAVRDARDAQLHGHERLVTHHQPDQRRRPARRLLAPDRLDLRARRQDACCRRELHPRRRLPAHASTSPGSRPPRSC